MKKTTTTNNKKTVAVNTNDSYNYCKNRIQSKFDKLNINPTLIDIKEINLSDIVSNKNKVRFNGEDTNVIDKIVEIIKNNEYKPFDHIPPIVDVNDDGTYTLISGHHRRHAHNNLKLKTMMCAVVDFDDNEKDRATWRTAENCSSFEPFVKNVTKMEDHVDDVANRIAEGIIANTATDIKSYLLDTGIVSKHAGKLLKDYINKINFALGNLKDYIHNWHHKEKSRIASQIESSTTNTKCLSVTFKVLGNDIDFDYRVMKNTFDSLSENSNRNVRIVASVTNANETKLQEIRKYKLANLVSDYVEDCRKVVALVDSGIDLSKLITIDFLPQLGSEINKDNDFGKSRYIENAIEDCNSKVDTQENDDVKIVKILEYINENCDTKTKKKLKKMLSK